MVVLNYLSLFSVFWSKYVSIFDRFWVDVGARVPVEGPLGAFWDPGFPGSRDFGSSVTCKGEEKQLFFVIMLKSVKKPINILMVIVTIMFVLSLLP